MLFGAKWLVDGCVRLSREFGISEFIVSVIIIGIGTSLPELFVSVISGSRDLGTLVISNNVASNIINILGILGIGALIYPIILRGRDHLSDIVFLCAASFMLAIFIWTGGMIYRIEGVLLFAILFIYLFWVWKNQHNFKSPVSEKNTKGSSYKMFLLITIGIIMLWVGSEMFMDSIEDISRIYKINQVLAGVLLVGPATAIPELIVTIIAAIRRRAAIAVGNIIGSCFMNIVLVISTGAIIINLAAPPVISYFHIPFMLFATFVLCFDLFVHGKISRIKGAIYLLLLGLYLYLSVFFGGIF